MSNEINTQNTISGSRISPQSKATAEKTQASAAASESSVSATPGESMSVSSQLSRLGELSKNLAEMPAVDAAKVAEIKQALADGTLTIDTDKIAESIIDFENSHTE